MSISIKGPVTASAHDLLLGTEGKEHVNQFRIGLKKDYYGSAILSTIVEMVARVFGQSGLKGVYNNYITALNKDQLPTKTHEKIQELAKKVLAVTGKTVAINSITQGNACFGKLSAEEKFGRGEAPIIRGTEDAEKCMKELSDLVVKLKSTFNNPSSLQDFNLAIKNILSNSGVEGSILDELTSAKGLSSFLIESAAQEFAKTESSELDLSKVNQFVEKMKEFGVTSDDKDHCEVKAWHALTKHLNIQDINTYASGFTPAKANEKKQAEKDEVQKEIETMVGEIKSIDKDVKAGWIALQRAKATFILGIQKRLTDDKDGKLTQSQQKEVELVLTDDKKASGAEKMLDEILKKDAFGNISICIKGATLRDVNFTDIQQENLKNLKAIEDAKQAYNDSLAKLHELKGNRTSDVKAGTVLDVGYSSNSPLGLLVKKQKEAGEKIPAEFKEVEASCQALIQKIDKWTQSFKDVKPERPESMAKIIMKAANS